MHAEWSWREPTRNDMSRTPQDFAILKITFRVRSLMLCYGLPCHAHATLLALWAMLLRIPRHRYAMPKQPNGRSTKPCTDQPTQPTAHSRSILLHQALDLPRQLPRLDLTLRFRVDSDRVLRPGRTHETAALDIHADQLVDFVLQALGLDESALGVGGFEDAAVGDFDALQVVGQVDVGVVPVVHGPLLVGEDDFGEEQVGESVADGLVDEVDARTQGVEGVFLAGGFRLRVADYVDCVGGEEDGAVAVGFEVDTDVVAGGGVVQVFDAGGRALDGELEDLGDVFGGGAVGVGGLHDADFEGRIDAGNAGHVGEEGGAEGGDAVAVQELEGLGGGGVVVDDAVGVAVEAAVACVGIEAQACGCTLFRLDEVGTALGGSGV